MAAWDDKNGTVGFGIGLILLAVAGLAILYVQARWM